LYDSAVVIFHDTSIVHFLLDRRRSVLRRILGAIGVIWGGFVLLSMFDGAPAPDPARSPAYHQGRMVGFYASMAFAAVLFVVGLTYLIRGSGGSRKKTVSKGKGPGQISSDVGV
jgi:hypothetical protein